MTRKFKMKAGLPGALSLPGLPGVIPGVVVEGDEYARFCPAVLEEVIESVSEGAVVASPAVPVLAPEPVSVTPEASVVQPEEAEPEPPNMGWSKAELVEYASGLGLNVEGMTKAQILGAIEKEEGSS